MKANIKRNTPEQGPFTETVNVNIQREIMDMALVEILEGSAKGCTILVDKKELVK